MFRDAKIHQGRRLKCLKFCVAGFKNFRDAYAIDFSKTHNYDFDAFLIKNNLINKALLHGKNGSGKSNLCFTLMDITTYLADNQGNPLNYALFFKQ